MANFISFWLSLAILAFRDVEEPLNTCTLLFSVHLISTAPYDAFMIQVRGRDSNNSVVFAGQFEDVPGIAAMVKCGSANRAAVVDKGGCSQNGQAVVENM